MTKAEALALIDAHKNALLNPVEMLNWTWLRVIIDQISEEEWTTFVQKSLPTLSS